MVISGVPGGGGLANGAATITFRPGTPDLHPHRKNGTAVAAFSPFPVVTGDRYLAQRDIVAATLEAPIQIETATPHGCATGQTVQSMPLRAIPRGTTPMPGRSGRSR